MEFEDLNYYENELLLRRLKKYLNYQISTFLLFALSVFSIILIIAVEQAYTLLMFLLIELGIFYFYCFSLRFAIYGWVEEIETVRLTEYQTKKIKEKLGNGRSSE